MRARRALLYVPGDDLHKIQKSITLDVDTICLDLEDGVAHNRKQVARETISKALSSLDFGRSECLVRINPPGSQNFELDLQEILPGRPDGIVLPKVTGGEQILHTNEIISSIETEYGWPPGAIILVAIVESAQAVVNLESIASSHSRLEALIFGAEDFAATIGAKRSTPGWEVFFARSAVVTYSAAHDLQAIDMVNIDFQDLDDLRTQSEQGARMGFSGKQIIHVMCNLQKPLTKLFWSHYRITTPAAAIFYLFIGKYCLTIRTPIDSGLLFVRKSLLVHF